MSAQREFADGEAVPGTRYRVVSLIGSGGMGSVYEVEHEELGKRFVLKALLRSLTNRDDLVHRLRNEWRALGRLEHPNIVSVTDAGVTTTGVPYYVMERLQGETLSARLRREYRLDVADALGIAADVLDGLSAAHRIGIVHRDVKPPNIYLVAGGAAKLLDFGIAKMLDPKASQITGKGIAIGTPRYMAPEQATGGTVDARTDLYATGLILFEMIAGTGPFDEARDANQLFLAHLAKDAPPVSEKAPRVPRALDPLLARLLSKKAEERPSNAALVANELRALRQEIGAPSGTRRKEPDDRTNPGGPFDTLESAKTVPSDQHVARTKSPLNDATTRSGMGPAPDPAAPTHGGATVRVDAFVEDDRAEAPTRTAAPPSHLETPPPVEPAARPKPAPAKSRWVALVLVIVAGAGVAAAASFSVHHGTEVLASQQATDVPLPPVAHAPQASPTSAPLPTIEAALPRPYEATTEGPVSLMKVPAALGGVASARAPTASAPRRPTGTPKNSGASAPESRGSALPTSGL